MSALASVKGWWRRRNALRELCRDADRAYRAWMNARYAYQDLCEIYSDHPFHPETEAAMNTVSETCGEYLTLRRRLDRMEGR